MKQIFLFLVIAGGMMAMSSCNPNALNPVLFTSADKAYVDSNSFYLVLPTKAQRPDEWDAKQKKYVKQTPIPAKTKVKVLAFLRSTAFKNVLSEMLVDLQDGSRTTIKCEGLMDNAGLSEEEKAEFDKKLNKLPYYCESTRSRRISFEEAKTFVGKPLAEAENEIIPADKINVRGRMKTAVFSQVRVMSNDSIVSYPLTFNVQNDNIMGIVINKPNNTEADAGFLTKALAFVVAYSGETLFIPPIWSKDTWLGAKLGMSDIVRIIIADILWIILMFVAYMLFIPWISTKLFIYIHPFSNGAIITLGNFVWFILAMYGIIFFSGYNIIAWIFLLVVVWATSDSVRQNVKFDRCPYCHTVGKMRFDGESDNKSYTGYSGVYSRDEIVKVEKQGNTTTRWHQKKNYRKRTKTKHWKDNFFCYACKRSVSYNESSSSSEEVSA
ncbi:MAG: hypothetical protein LBM07_05275 [Culturomica sp.]|jgi:Zn-finger nucleic acid-binding protein|nr:hypothetical protein [Culturomica sp.]